MKNLFCFYLSFSSRDEVFSVDLIWRRKSIFKSDVPENL